MSRPVVEREISRQPAAGAEGVDVAVACHGSMTGFGALELLARAGFLVKGVVYIVVGALASRSRPISADA